MRDTCPKCGAELHSGMPQCRICGFFIAEKHGAIQQLPPPFLQPLAWESIASLGIAKALIRSMALCMLKPKRFFEQVSRSHDIFMAWIYGMIVGSLGLVFNFIWGNLYAAIAENALGNTGFNYTPSAGPTAFALVMTPVIISANIVSLSVYCHIIFWLFCRQKRSLGDTFRIICYAHTPAFLTVIPLAGTIISTVWILYLVVAGEAYIHKIGRLKAFIILAFPLCVLGAVLILFCIILLAAAGLAAGSFFKDFIYIFR